MALVVGVGASISLPTILPSPPLLLPTFLASPTFSPPHSLSTVMPTIFFFFYVFLTLFFLLLFSSSLFFRFSPHFNFPSSPLSSFLHLIPSFYPVPPHSSLSIRLFHFSTPRVLLPITPYSPLPSPQPTSFLALCEYSPI